MYERAFAMPFLQMRGGASEEFGVLLGNDKNYPYLSTTVMRKKKKTARYPI